MSLYSQQWGLYTLYAPKDGVKAYLIDTADSPVAFHDWTFPSTAKNTYSTYLIPGDTLVRTTSYKASGAPGQGGTTGKIQKVTWDGTVAWSYQYSSTTTQMHHDICPMPNGNVLFISYDVKSSTQATQAGSSTAATFWSEKIIEVKPTGATTGEIVWEWHLWDHLCQNYNASKDNYVASIVDNPQLLNINYTGSGQLPDRWHMNGLDYNAALDQIAISIHYMNEVYVIDHSTTTEEAAGHTGGNSGKGGDFLYRWGNPAAYSASGTKIFTTVHDAHWVCSDHPTYPNFLSAYNNQGGTGGKTAINIWGPPYNGYNYLHTSGTAYTPSTSAYQYNAVFTATNEGNSQQLPNGNMLVNNFQANIYEVNSAGTILWTKTNAKSSHAYRFTKCQIRGPVVSANASAQNIEPGNTVNLNSSALSVSETNPSYSYAWSGTDGYNSSQQNPIVNPVQTSTYTVTITDTNVGCSATASVTINVNATSVKSVTNSENRVTVFPNPVREKIQITGANVWEKVNYVTLVDACGKELLRDSNIYEINVQDMKNGMYALFFYMKDNSKEFHKIIILK
ncbi:MAG: hypothetical protein A2275_14110 [Bacteroidetes bacterium RIFOXYA12_FULL_35_11]|nr:MAG: hypothetical protein A2X01_09755 [Bacteroidetes bacterium GWF2_35_48]OFY73492.1 MAG: hypothetical protein A2275_14110 [Bacteroidetes bacterium RIFOXYA12_FULL_35_11]OFY92978.1 MAG: hypothetical protein A2491_04730 [Bacteroidetes bacterium RIFOXYC12_FULL_35_7]